MSFASCATGGKEEEGGAGGAGGGGGDVTAGTITDRPYGAWESPITSKAITAGSVNFAGLWIGPSTGDLYWLEGRPEEGGRYVLCRYSREKKTAVDVSPRDSNVRTRVHEYGGGAVVMGTTSSKAAAAAAAAASQDNDDDDDGDVIFFSEFTTQQLCRLRVLPDGTTEVMPVTPAAENGGSSSRYRFADGVLDGQDGQTMYCVREDHGQDGKAHPARVVNEIVAVSAETGAMTVVATGNDFYAAPRLSPDGTKLAYVTWNHPNMPWDGTELRVVEILRNDVVADNQQDDDDDNNNGGDGDVVVVVTKGKEVRVAGDADAGNESVLQPLWHPKTGQLYYLSDRSGYYNLYRSETDHHVLATREEKECPASAASTSSILPMEADFGGSAPGWILGQQGYAFLPDGRLVATYQKDGASVLVVATAPTTEVSSSSSSGATVMTDVREYTGTRDGLPAMFGGVITTASSTNSAVTNDNGFELYFLGGSPSTPMSVYRWNLLRDDDGEKQPRRAAAEILARSSALDFPDTVISIPRQIEFPTVGNRTAFGYYYPPKNDRFRSSSSSATTALPPLLVKAHGGPTACARTTFNAALQFWTSRGFALLDVDYGGSTGYGRDYRRRLDRSWGIVDVNDVCAGARYLVERGYADGERLCIDGGSAGGYTTLAALAYRNVFKAGCSLYGVADLTALAGDTHKFESRYLDGLVGSYPRDERVYRDRSPIESVDTLSCPILLLQGEEDEIVPPNQARMMHEALVKKGIPTCLKIYQGEQHGFRKAENIEDALDSELAFYGKVFGIDIPGALELPMDNL